MVEPVTLVPVVVEIDPRLRATLRLPAPLVVFGMPAKLELGLELPELLLAAGMRFGFVASRKVLTTVSSYDAAMRR